MKKLSSCWINRLMSLAVLSLVACTGAEIGLNELKAVNPTEPLSALEPSLRSTDGIGGLVDRLIRDYRQYGALYSVIEKERPRTSNTCYELTDRVARTKPLLKEQENALADAGTVYEQLTLFAANDQAVRSAAEIGVTFLAKARERVRKYNELADITNSFASDCPSGGDMVLHILTGVSGIVQYEGAKAKVPMFNKAVEQLEALSAEERALASEVVLSLKALNPLNG